MMMNFDEIQNSRNEVEYCHDLVDDDMIKTRIANHPRYADLLSAHIHCRMVGAPPELAFILDQLDRRNNSVVTGFIRSPHDPELDQFMEAYCELLRKHKEDLSKPFDEATEFLSNIESQLSSLCEGGLPVASSGDVAESSSEEQSYVETCEGQELSDQELKELLQHKYSSCLSSLRTQFLKKKKKSKLPENAKTALLGWWNSHYRWPYPTEEEKVKLSESTGLDQKQINNWFINQRKRHWKPSEDARYAFTVGNCTSVGASDNI